MLALAAGLLCGGVAFLVLYRQAAEMEKKTTPVEVLVASRFIPAGCFLTADCVGKKSIPESYVSPSAIREPRDVEGLMTLVNISAGEQILSNKFGLGEESLALALSPGRRAYTLEVGETSGVGGLIRPGNHVDILTKVDSNKREITSFVFQNLTVLAVGQKLSAGPQARSNPNTSNGASDSGYSTVTLAVTPEQAETLMYLEGRPLRLVLRSAGDEEIVSVPAESEAEILSKLGRFTPPPRRKIEVINAGSRQGE